MHVEILTLYVADASLIDNNVLEDMDWIQTFILGVRQIRSDLDFKPGKALPVLIHNGSTQDK